MELSPAKPETAVSIQKDDKVHIIRLSHDESRAIFQAFEGQVPTSIHHNVTIRDIEHLGFLYDHALKTLVWGVDILDKGFHHNGIVNIFHGTSTLYTLEGISDTLEYIVQYNFKVVISKDLLRFMFEDEFMRFVGGHCNEEVRCVYYMLACLVDAYFYCERGIISYTSAVLDILKHIGDDGSYVWLHILNRLQCELDIGPSLMEYVVANSGFAVYCLTSKNPRLLPNGYVIGTNSNKRQRSE
jgi:hypothetical protein